MFTGFYCSAPVDYNVFLHRTVITLRLTKFCDAPEEVASILETTITQHCQEEAPQAEEGAEEAEALKAEEGEEEAEEADPLCEPESEAACGATACAEESRPCKKHRSTKRSFSLIRAGLGAASMLMECSKAKMPENG